ncbi:MAG: Cysteine protease atg4 [Vezdaea aestivalis]|nr:MAG: Cysteine protease atg4 [Vezdaea aestivalis]
MSGVDFGGYKRIVRYFWDPQPTNDDPASMWCLGVEYPQPSDALEDSVHVEPATKIPTDEKSKEMGASPNLARDSSLSSSIEDGLAYHDSEQPGAPDGGWPSAFLDDFEARIWMTYRSNFTPIPKSQDPKANARMTFAVRLRSQLLDQEGFTSDTGWGCMIRSGQSLLANSILSLKLGRDWRTGTQIDEERHILSLFADEPSAPFSIHRFVAHGAKACGKHPGEWFGPAATAQCIESLSESSVDKSGLHVYVTDGGDVYEDKFMKVAKAGSDTIHPTLILAGVRLGIERVTPAYWDALKATLQMPQSIGIAGGRPAASHYFVGVQGSTLFYLDPHHTRPSVATTNGPDNRNMLSEEDVQTYHTRRLRRIQLDEMDPSMLIGFLIRDEADWKSWKELARKAPGKPVIHIGENEPRVGAVEEVEAFDDEGEGEDGFM